MIIKNKTQQRLVNMLKGLESTSLKKGVTKFNNVLSIQLLNLGNQAHALARNNPELFEVREINFRLTKLEYIGKDAL